MRTTRYSLLITWTLAVSMFEIAVGRSFHGRPKTSSVGSKTRSVRSGNGSCTASSVPAHTLYPRDIDISSKIEIASHSVAETPFSFVTLRGEIEEVDEVKLLSYRVVLYGFWGRPEEPEEVTNTTSGHGITMMRHGNNLGFYKSKAYGNSSWSVNAGFMDVIPPAQLLVYFLFFTMAYSL